MFLVHHIPLKLGFLLSIKDIIPSLAPFEFISGLNTLLSYCKPCDRLLSEAYFIVFLAATNADIDLELIFYIILIT